MQLVNSPQIAIRKLFLMSLLAAVYWTRCSRAKKVIIASLSRWNIAVKDLRGHRIHRYCDYTIKQYTHKNNVLYEDSAINVGFYWWIAVMTMVHVRKWFFWRWGNRRVRDWWALFWSCCCKNWQSNHNIRWYWCCHWTLITNTIIRKILGYFFFLILFIVFHFSESW